MIRHREKRIDEEPIAVSIAFTAVPIVGEAVISLAKRIHETVQDIESNEKDCHELDKHIQEVVRCLRNLHFNARINQELRESMNNLQICLTECFEFLQDYTTASAIGLIIRSRHYKKKFEELNKNLVGWKDRFLFVANAHTLVENARSVQVPRRKLVLQPRHIQLPPAKNHPMIKSPIYTPHPHRHVPHQYIQAKSPLHPIYYTPAPNRKHYF